MNTNSLQKHLNQNAFCFVIRNIQDKQKTNDVVVNFKSRFKIKFNKFFKSFKFEKFTINFNSKSTSIKSNFESIIKSNVVVANSIFISIFISISNIKESETKKISDYIQKIMKQEIVVVVVAVIETIKSEIINLNDINFFDSIMQVDF